MLQKVREKARIHINQFKNIDEIEVLLAFQTELREKLDLPISTQKMLYVDCAKISDEEIQKIGDEILTEVTESDVNTFLATWNPWLKHQRNKQVIKFNALNTIQLSDHKESCLITLCPFEDLDLPVFYAGSVYEYEGFVTYFIESGKDPSNRKEIVFSDLKRVIRS